MGLLSPGRGRGNPQPSDGVWPGLFDPPAGPAHAAVARGISRTAFRKLPITMRFPDGDVWGLGGPEIEVKRPDEFFLRVGRDGLIGFGEAWMVGDITTGGWHPSAQPVGSIYRKDAAAINAATDELAAALTVMAGRMSSLVPKPLQRLRAAWHMVKPDNEENTLGGSAENIHRHYDLSNELFELFLDETMTYSSAWYTDGAPEDLTTAQLRKIDGILDLAGVRPGMRILEIGSGWGALAIRAADQRGAHVTTLTLSSAQKTLAEKRIAEAGFTDRIEVRLEDYRSHLGQYDAVVSVEMIEAVGEKYWPQYFQCVDRLLAPGGKAALQAITIEHERLQATRNSYTWIHKYVFPGGELPSLRAIDSALATTSLRVGESRRIGPSYARTLEEWRHRFNSRLDEVADLGFDETFVRMWNFYLAYTQAGFASRYIDDFQLSLSRD